MIEFMVSWWAIPLTVVGIALLVGLGLVMFGEDIGDGGGGYFGGPSGGQFFGCFLFIAAIFVGLVVLALWGWLR